MDFERHAWNRVRKLGDELFEREVTTLAIAAGGQEQELPFDSLVGVTVKGNEDAYWMETPKDRPTNEYLLTYGNNLLVAYYSDVAGKLDKPVLIVEPTEFPHPSISGEKLCAAPLFSAKYADYNCLFYVFEDTSDTLGLGLTVPKGWYAVNVTTFALTPLDINECPVIFPGEFIRNGDVVDDWIKDNSTYKGEFSFVAGEKHCVWVNDDSFYVTKYPQLFALSNRALAAFVLFAVIRGAVHPILYDITLSKTTSTIDPKFLPDMEGADENWLSVDVRDTLGVQLMDILSATIQAGGIYHFQFTSEEFDAKTTEWARWAKRGTGTADYMHAFRPQLPGFCLTDDPLVMFCTGVQFNGEFKENAEVRGLSFSCAITVGLAMVEALLTIYKGGTNDYWDVVCRANVTDVPDVSPIPTA